MGLLLDDVNSNGVVSNAARDAVKAQVALSVASGNLRNDVTANGTLRNAEVSVIKGKSERRCSSVFSGVASSICIG